MPFLAAFKDRAHFALGAVRVGSYAGGQFISGEEAMSRHPHVSKLPSFFAPIHEVPEEQDPRMEMEAGKAPSPPEGEEGLFGPGCHPRPGVNHYSPSPDL